jgi:hypothetical protein
MKSKCSAVRPVQEEGINDYSFRKFIPVSLHSPIKKAVSMTLSTGKEQALTFCRIKNTNKIFVASHVVGSDDQTTIKPCDTATSEQMGDLHTHPTQDSNTVGITPSTSDIVSTLTDSTDHKIAQISCITGPDSKYISCYQPKQAALNDKQKIENYKKTLNQTEGKVTDIPPYLRENVGNDFYHAWYSKSSFRRTVPTPKDVVKDAFARSGKYLREKDVPEPEKPRFCELISSINYPTPDKRVFKACVEYLRKNYIKPKH